MEPNLEEVMRLSGDHENKSKNQIFSLMNQMVSKKSSLTLLLMSVKLESQGQICEKQGEEMVLNLSKFVDSWEQRSTS